MYLDVAAADSYGRYNIKFASIVGLNTAVYWSCIMNILKRVGKKKTYDEQGYFTLNRTYVEEQTTLTKEQQLECDCILSKLQLIHISEDSSNKISCDMKVFFSLITEENQKVLSEISKISSTLIKSGQKEGKKAGIIHRLQSRVNESDSEIYNLYCNLVEVAYEKGMSTNAQIDLFQETLNKYTSNSETKKEILQIAIASGYKVVDWAIQIYEKNHKAGSRLGEQKISSGVKEGVKF